MTFETSFVLELQSFQQNIKLYLDKSEVLNSGLLNAALTNN